jgi:dephospho-CoA kinase
VFVLAVTGGIGSGKTEAAAYFAAKGAEVIDLDELAKSLLEPGAPAYDAVVGEFGSSVTDRDGRIVHEYLAREAFASREATERLDSVVHPLVVGALAARLQALADAGRTGVTVIDVPLLVEAPEIAEMAEVVLAIEAPVTSRLERCRARGMSDDDVLARMDRQAGDAERREIADDVIDNSDTKERFHAQLDGFWEREVAPHVA